MGIHVQRKKRGDDIKKRLTGFRKGISSREKEIPHRLARDREHILKTKTAQLREKSKKNALTESLVERTDSG